MDAPCLARWRAMARPMPREEPVMRAAGPEAGADDLLTQLLADGGGGGEGFSAGVSDDGDGRVVDGAAVDGGSELLGGGRHEGRVEGAGNVQAEGPTPPLPDQTRGFLHGGQGRAHDRLGGGVVVARLHAGPAAT